MPITAGEFQGGGSSGTGGSGGTGVSKVQPDGTDTITVTPSNGEGSIQIGVTPGTYAPIAQGTGAILLAPSGDTSGTTDSAAINTAIAANPHVLLQQGQWYIGAPSITTGSRWLQGQGAGTVINVVTGAAGISITDVPDIQVSDMSFSIGSGAYAMTLTAPYDSNFWNLYLTGSAAAGGIYIQGDTGMEQTWTNIVGRNVGGKGFQLVRTTSGNTGSLYMTNVRFVTPPAGAYGFYATSSAGSPSLNGFTMVDCVFDDYLEDACYINNFLQCFIDSSWFAVGSTAAAGSAGIHIVGGGGQFTISNSLTYNGLASGGYGILASSGAYGVNVDNHIFGAASSSDYALGLSGLSPIAGAGFNLGNYQLFGPTLTDTPSALVWAQPVYPGNAGLPGGNVGEETLPRWTVNANNITLTSGLLMLSYFTAAKTELIGHIECSTGGAAASGYTYAGMGLFTVSSAGLLTLVAKGEQTSSWTLWNSEYSYPGVNISATKIALSAGYTKIAGRTYAVGALYVGSSAPQVAGTLLLSGGGGLAVASTPLGMISAQLAGQSTLGTIGSTTHAQAALASCSYAPYFILES